MPSQRSTVRERYKNIHAQVHLYACMCIYNVLICAWCVCTCIHMCAHAHTCVHKTSPLRTRVCLKLLTMHICMVGMVTSRECVRVWFRECRRYISSSVPSYHLKLVRRVWNYSIAPISVEHVAELSGRDEVGHLLSITLTAGQEEVGQEWLLRLGTCSPVP